jgi:DNA polymerase-3 subunit epsilon
MNTSFTALDFETAHGKRWSICQVGLVRYEQGVIAREVSLLVRPPANVYWRRFTEIHGLGSSDTIDAPSFAEIWPQLREFIDGQMVVAHSIGFDRTCLNQALAYYGLEQPAYETACTLRVYGQALNLLCDEYGIELNHHDALSDARACGELYLRHLLQVDGVSD